MIIRPNIATSNVTSLTSSPFEINISSPETRNATRGAMPDMLCFSHLRWDFVFQRPQHLMTRFAKQQRVFFVEEPIFSPDYKDSLHVSQSKENVIVVTPHFRTGTSQEQIIYKTSRLIGNFILKEVSSDYIFWYYTPMALEFTRHFAPVSVVYDCMDELKNFAGASPQLVLLEKELLAAADIVFTGGESLYQAKKDQHENIYAMPSSIDKSHFQLARAGLADPDDQRDIPRPRFGFYGVIDERFDIVLLKEIAALKPMWHFVIVGPVVKIAPSSLPKLDNIHYLESKTYAQLPSYLGNWDVAIMPFAINDATKYISPTKTPEFLAGGKPVVSTPITDVVNPYGKMGLVSIASDPKEFISCCEKALKQSKNQMFLHRVDSFLRAFSWDRTWGYMDALLRNEDLEKQNISA